MALALERGRAEGCRACYLDVAGHSPAVRFYERLGFRVAARTTVPGLPGVGEHFRMTLDL